MKLSRLLILTVTLALPFGVAWAQGGTSAASSVAGKVAAPPAASSASPAAAPADTNGNRVSTPDVTDAIKAEVQAKAAAAPPAGSVAVSLPRGAGGRRDPFLSPLVMVKKDNPTGLIDQVECGAGKRCLVPDQLVLKGIVKSREGMIAMVENQQQKSYVLHERDMVYRGTVVKITGDSVIFRQSMGDSQGHVTEKMVVKKVSDPVKP